MVFMLQKALLISRQGHPHLTSLRRQAFNLLSTQAEALVFGLTRTAILGCACTLPGSEIPITYRNHRSHANFGAFENSARARDPHLSLDKAPTMAADQISGKRQTLMYCQRSISLVG